MFRLHRYRIGNRFNRKSILCVTEYVRF